MIEFINKKCILWDFDGVILDSMRVREEGFQKVLASFSISQIDSLIEFHRKNGGLSRYVKFEYFLTEILGEDKNYDRVKQWSHEFSEIMRRSLTSKSMIINEVITFIKNNWEVYQMHIVSGSDENELRFLCDALAISRYFKSIHGSPTPKIELVGQLILDMGYLSEEVCLIGDSINDFEASESNEIQFFGYNNPKLKEMGLNYINSFE